MSSVRIDRYRLPQYDCMTLSFGTIATIRFVRDSMISCDLIVCDDPIKDHLRDCAELKSFINF